MLDLFACLRELITLRRNIWFLPHVAQGMNMVEIQFSPDRVYYALTFEGALQAFQNEYPNKVALDYPGGVRLAIMMPYVLWRRSGPQNQIQNGAKLRIMTTLIAMHPFFLCFPLSYRGVSRGLQIFSLVKDDPLWNVPSGDWCRSACEQCPPSEQQSCHHVRSEPYICILMRES